MKLAVFSIIILVVLFVRFAIYYSERTVYKPGDSYVEEHTFLKEPKRNSFGQYFFDGGVLVTFPLFPRYEYADRVILKGLVSESISQEGKKLLIVKNPEVSRTEINNGMMLAVGKFVRQRIISGVFSVLPAKEGGLLVGIVLGVRDKIGGEFYKTLREAGVLHVIAASGANVGIIAGFLLPVFQRSVKRRLAILFTASFIVFYSFLTGFDPPIMRASVMAIISFSALALGRQNLALIALFLTAGIMLFIKPELLEDVSFQLSFAATFGILTIKVLIDKVLGFKFLNILKDDISTTVSAQIATLPILLLSFGAYSLLSLPVNFLVLWTIPIIMALGGIGSLVAIISPAFSQPFFLLCYPFLAYFRLVVEGSEAIPASFTLSTFPLALVAGYYLIVLTVIFKLKQSYAKNLNPN